MDQASILRFENDPLQFSFAALTCVYHLFPISCAARRILRWRAEIGVPRRRFLALSIEQS